MSRNQRFLLKINENIFSLVFILTLPLFYLRGKNFSLVLFGDDAEFVSHALNRRPPFGFFPSLDSWGLLDPFNGYLAVYLRLITKLILFAGNEDFTTHTFWVMTIYWSAISGLLASTLKKFSGPLIGWGAGFVLAVMPYSNSVMLAQVNTIAWPACLLTLVVAGTRQYPIRLFSKIILLLLFAGTAASTGTAIVTIAALGVNVLRHRGKFLSFERLLFACTGLGFGLQYLSFTPRNNPPVPLTPEILKISFGFAPQYIRAQVLDPLSALETIVLYSIPIVAFICLGVLVWLGLNIDRQRVLTGVQFIVEGVFLALLLTTANGWLNSHYLFIPTALLWLGALLIGSVSIKSVRPWKMVPLVILTTLLFVGISGTYFVI
jgi:hypothetical protein